MACGAFGSGGGAAGSVHVFDPISGALMVTGDGCPVTSLHTSLGWTALASRMYTPFELRFDGLPWTSWAAFTWDTGLVYALCAVYLVLSFGVQASLRAMPQVKFDLRAPLAAWNLALALFSAIGAFRLLPHLAYIISHDGYYASVCQPAEPSFGHGAAGLWTMLFVFSKVPELLDTAFVVLRRRPLIFLHWYHHVTVLLYCWHSYATRASPGLYFAAVNYAVHAVMYYYYHLQAIGARPRWGAYVTAFQISQMFLGMGVVGSTIAYKWVAHKECDVQDSNITAALVMYSSYAALFIWFAFNRYCLGGGRGGGKEE